MTTEERDARTLKTLHSLEDSAYNAGLAGKELPLLPEIRLTNDPAEEARSIQNALDELERITDKGPTPPQVRDVVKTAIGIYIQEYRRGLSDAQKIGTATQTA